MYRLAYDSCNAFVFCNKFDGIQGTKEQQIETKLRDGIIALSPLNLDARGAVSQTGS